MFDKVIAYLTKPFFYLLCILKVVFFIDRHCAGVSDKHCLLSFFFSDRYVFVTCVPGEIL